MVQSTISNWGRWGADDQLGALNLLTPELVLKAVGMVKKAMVYSLAVPLERDGPQFAPFNKTWKVSITAPGPEDSFTGDVVTMYTHSGTHIDALGHTWAEADFTTTCPRRMASVPVCRSQA